MTPGFWSALGGALAVLTTVITTYLQTRNKIREVHLLVNSSLDSKINRIVQLVGTLKDAGVEVPPLPQETATPPPPP
jgi:hypothetical protein